MTAPQEGTVAGDGLDREAVRRRLEAAGVDLAWVLECALHDYAVTERDSAEDERPDAERQYLLAAADAAEALANLALLDALEAAEAEVARLQAERSRLQAQVERLAYLPTEGGAS